MSELLWVLGLRPAEVEAHTGMKHQHRLKPEPGGLGESHVSLWTMLRWMNGLGLCLPRVLERLPTLVVLWDVWPHEPGQGAETLASWPDR